VLGGLQVLDYLVRASRNARNEAVASWAAGQASRS
jgi:hypothetical protein